MTQLQRAVIGIGKAMVNFYYICMHDSINRLFVASLISISKSQEAEISPEIN